MTSKPSRLAAPGGAVQGPSFEEALAMMLLSVLAAITGLLVLLAPGFVVFWKSRNRGGSIAQHFWLTRPRAIHFLSAVLIGTSVWILMVTINGPFLSWFEIDDNMEYVQERLLAPQSMWLKLLELAILPALCEEFIFRGVIARGLATRLPGKQAIVISALFFGALHFSVLRIAPTALLGVVLAVFLFRAKNLWIVMFAHALNNCVAVMLSNPGSEEVIAFLSSHGEWVVALAAVMTLGGLALAKVNWPRLPGYT